MLIISMVFAFVNSPNLFVLGNLSYIFPFVTKVKTSRNPITNAFFVIFASIFHLQKNEKIFFNSINSMLFLRYFRVCTLAKVCAILH